MKGWFNIPGQQDGARTVEMQMRGLSHALAEARGKTVLDIGCAEGCISFEFMLAGASKVFGFDCNDKLLSTAVLARRKLPRAKRLRTEFLRCDFAEMPRGKWDIVLALAIIHKLPEPADAVRRVAGSCKRLVVIRLPRDSTGEIVSKHTARPCNVNEVMQDCGFALERVVQGPPRELVQYWRRA